MKCVLLPLGVLVMLFVGASAATAATCTAQSTGVAFGSYDTLSNGPLDSTGSINVQCDLSTAFTIDLGTGSGTYGQRTLTGGGRVLDYNLYTDSTRMLVWADGTAGGDVSDSGTNVSVPVYGRIPQRQNVGAGIYSDTVVITVSY